MEILYGKRAVKHIEGFDKPTKKRLKDAIEKIPFGDITKLKGFQNEYRLRVGTLRVLFSMTNDIVIIKDVLSRGQAYKHMGGKTYGKRSINTFNRF